MATKMITTEPRVRFQPLADLVAYQQGVPAHTTPCTACWNDSTITRACLTKPELARLLGVSQRTVDRWKVRGVALEAADRLATRLGYNPVAIWGFDWDAATDITETVGSGR